ncbi:MAG: hypothetical protein ACK5JH_13160 [Anaerocolumna sp.]
MSELTNETMKAFKIIFCEYKARMSKGFTKENSIVFEDGTIESLPQFSEWLRPDINSAISELKYNEFIFEDVIGNRKLTDPGIKYMEAKPKEFFNDLKSLFDIVSILV